MGNALGGATTVKIMKETGETLKLSMPVRAGDVVKDYPGYVLLESQSVKSLGIKSRPLEPHQELEHERLYFLVELPKEAVNDDEAGRGFQLGNKPSAKDRLDGVVLARRLVSDPSTMSRATILSKEGNGHGGLRLKLRLPKAEVEKLIKESKDDAEVTDKIMELYVALASANDTNEGLVGRRVIAMDGSKDVM
ncbi:uncharacterized protein At1g66480 [Eucalyptus grandis]|uniref:Uncharacterized protein n=2 Tax=Eucalyptus grandis TaxID=71139 RepID=A0ACC3LUU2_EUCGR|nr:uncharacterized protein At1g66480 [Eucalyptus grandis]KAK3442628.1 hypothetical protein EUGRSUZ_B02897 [Eucalyptus grandis]